MENVTLDIVYNEIKKLELVVQRMDEKVENFMGFFALTKQERIKLLKLKSESKKTSVSINEFAKEMGVEL
jgi:hypothetical protein